MLRNGITDVTEYNYIGEVERIRMTKVEHEKDRQMKEKKNSKVWSLK